VRCHWVNPTPFIDHLCPGHPECSAELPGNRDRRDIARFSSRDPTNVCCCMFRQPSSLLRPTNSR
jgi:hypothetical protein